MRVEFDVANAEMLLRPGMTARVVLELRTFEDAVTVPVSALHTRGAESAVFVVKDEVAERRLVRTAVESAAWIHIVTGLGGDEGIVVSSAEPLTDGLLVPRGGQQRIAPSRKSRSTKSLGLEGV